MNVFTSFLNGALDEDVYLEQFKGYVFPGKSCVPPKEISFWTETGSTMMEQVAQ